MPQPVQCQTPAPRTLPSGLPRWKRLLDVVVSVAALPLLGLLTLLMTVVAATRSPGPVMYRQPKVGHRGRRIMIYRFRTLRIDEADAPSDSRGPERTVPTIPLGGFLRFSGLGELPQLLNVLRGEMTLVGPRPLALLEGPTPPGLLRQTWTSVPGLIGLPRNSNHLADWIAADLAYAATLSWWGDVRLLLRAAMVLVLRVLGFGGSSLNRDRMGIEPGESTVLVPGESRRPW